MRKLLSAELNRKTAETYKESVKTPVIVVLDNVRSLNNIGSIFRTADAFLIEAIFLCGISATPPHKEIYKTALGAEENVAWKYFKSTVSAIDYLKTEGYELVAVEQTNESIPLDLYPICRKTRYALIFGNEIKGVDQEVIDLCSGSIEIPQFGTKHSFNVAVCAGIVLWEWFRRIK
jgi:tRNA G18 (ribose-2'-O)-methylase SpoU